jgi:hypothetical protein
VLRVISVERNAPLLNAGQSDRLMIVDIDSKPLIPSSTLSQSRRITTGRVARIEPEVLSGEAEEEEEEENW